ncbi:MAG: hypothetical protein AMS16_03750 [Planctomycetes bacterium DG_58]|nr:MAG: hypothetical protein AMS16_03750 [Planctomycetes bacterium DG_58]KPL04316.1 MAG: hypothetical protein AMK75_01270 [Planctomycetes bacterium SM23_65]
MLGRFTERARKVIALTNEEVYRFNHSYIGTEHILLGLVKEGGGVAVKVLRNLRIDPEKVGTETEKLCQKEPEALPRTKRPYTPRAKKVIEFAVASARGLGHKYVGTEHLLLGLVQVDEGVAARVLARLGVTLDEVRKETLSLLGMDREGPEA